MNKKLLVTSVTVLLTTGCVYLARNYRKMSASQTARKYRLVRDNLLAMSQGISNRH
jgi:positive regulator of sigma E activity